MSTINDFLEELLEIADNPKNEFDKIISANKKFIGNMDLDSLCKLRELRRESYRLCRLMPFPRDEIAELVRSGESDPCGIFADLENKFACAEYVFSFYNGDMY